MCSIAEEKCTQKILYDAKTSKYVKGKADCKNNKSERVWKPVNIEIEQMMDAKYFLTYIS